MSNHKINLTGPDGAGKTTAIAAVSDIPPITNDVAASNITEIGKASTTVAMDYGLMQPAGGARIHLYGTPGQRRFDFMWNILTTGGGGLALLINNDAPDPMQNLRFYLKAFAPFIQQTRLVVGVTRMDLTSQPTLEDYLEQLSSLQIEAPVLNVDARRAGDVSSLIETLLYAAERGMVA